MAEWEEGVDSQHGSSGGEAEVIVALLSKHLGLNAGSSTGGTIEEVEPSGTVNLCFVREDK